MNSWIRQHHTSDSCTTTANGKQAPNGKTSPTGRMGDQALDYGGNHDMLTTLRTICPTCGGSSMARECGTAAKALYTCLILMGYSSCVSGDGARGCTRDWGSRGRRGGGVEKQTEDKKDGTANERQSSKGRAQEENAGLDRMQPTRQCQWKDGGRGERSIVWGRSVVMVTGANDSGRYFGLHWYPEIMRV